MADPRWMAVLSLIAFYCCVVAVAHSGRQVATASLANRDLRLGHHTDSLWALLCATILLLVIVLMLVNISVRHDHSTLFWVHESLDVLFLLLAALALIFNGNKSVNHRYLGWSMVALTVPIGITGSTLLYHLPMP